MKVAVVVHIGNLSMARALEKSLLNAGVSLPVVSNTQTDLVVKPCGFIGQEHQCPVAFDDRVYSAYDRLVPIGSRWDWLTRPIARLVFTPSIVKEENGEWYCQVHHAELDLDGCCHGQGVGTQECYPTLSAARQMYPARLRRAVSFYENLYADKLLAGAWFEWKDLEIWERPLGHNGGRPTRMVQWRRK